MEFMGKVLDEMKEVREQRDILLEALRILLVQFGEYKDGEGAAKFHAINIAQKAIARAEGKV